MFLLCNLPCVVKANERIMRNFIRGSGFSFVESSWHKS